MFGEAVEHIVPHVVQIAFHIWAKIIFYFSRAREPIFQTGDFTIDDYFHEYHLKNKKNDARKTNFIQGCNLKFEKKKFKCDNVE